ncbi:hypothetical protein VHEMI05325 [[Torrubiella] hemipterigena]|uniref:Alpha-ketoglutarate-dependent dioxygenase AlkB-like domain-containing protein n=1 Tax=[Torrubiella] hemipterigena TaxID=1531966 RepID=A0A0A1TGQ0_9HYPO|nr:hypothetical protein VHEMI05325 [[Torrubiella] hemipterigena]
MATTALPTSLEECRISKLPSTAYYIPNFISEEEEQQILEKIQTAPKPRWKQLTHRRLQTWPSDLVNNKLVEAPLPNWLEEPVISRIRSMATSEQNDQHLFDQSPHKRPNHVLINEYPPGVGIMPHKDGAAYWPVVCTVSLGSSLCLGIYKSKGDGAVAADPTWRILQEPRSLLITTDSLYTDFLHGISDIEQDEDISSEDIVNWELLGRPQGFQDGVNVRQLRTSLTYRDVLAVSTLGAKLGGLFRR